MIFGGIGRIISEEAVALLSVRLIPCSRNSVCFSYIKRRKRREAWGVQEVWRSCCHCALSWSSLPLKVPWSCLASRWCLGVGAVLGELQPVGSPCGISLGRTVSHGRDVMWSRGREWLGKSGRDKVQRADQSPHSLFCCTTWGKKVEEGGWRKSVWFALVS